MPLQLPSALLGAVCPPATHARAHALWPSRVLVGRSFMASTPMLAPRRWVGVVWCRRAHFSLGWALVRWLQHSPRHLLSTIRHAWHMPRMLALVGGHHWPFLTVQPEWACAFFTSLFQPLPSLATLSSLVGAWMHGLLLCHSQLPDLFWLTAWANAGGAEQLSALTNPPPPPARLGLTLHPSAHSRTHACLHACMLLPPLLCQVLSFPLLSPPFFSPNTHSSDRSRIYNLIPFDDAQHSARTTLSYPHCCGRLPPA